MTAPELELAEVMEFGERDRAVLLWRLEVLERAGYPAREAWSLARSRADLHRAVELLDAGATPEQALRILG